MSEFVTLTCPSCGGTLEVTSEIERFVCQYCGKMHIIKRSGGTIFLDGLAQVMTGVDRTGSELAIVRLKEEISALENRRVNRLKESQARKTNMLGLETVIKEAEKEKRREYLVLAVYVVIEAMFALLAVAGRSIAGVIGCAPVRPGNFCTVPKSALCGANTERPSRVT